jgi:hypothetical protein
MRIHADADADPQHCLMNNIKIWKDMDMDIVARQNFCIALIGFSKGVSVF